MASTSSRDGSYDPERFWDRKALRSGGDALRAACHDDLATNRCIDRVQRAALRRGIRYVERHRRAAAASVLDFGCGPGRWTHFFFDRGYRYTGVDISTEMLTLARARHPDARLDRVENDRLGYGDESFDVVCSVAAIHHNPYERQDRIAAELVRVLRPNGSLVLFEAVGPRVTDENTTFPRPIEDWTALFNRGRATLRLFQGMRYNILRAAALRIAGNSGSGLRRWTGAEPLARRETWKRLIDVLDVAVDPLLGRLLPPRLQTRALMIFRKEIAGAPYP